MEIDHALRNRRIEALKADYHESRKVLPTNTPDSEPAMEEFIQDDGFLPGEESAAIRALGEADEHIGEMIDRLENRSGIRSGPRPHYVRGGNEGFVRIEPSRYEWQQWAEKMDAKAERFDEQLGQPKPPQETFRQRYWRENEHEIRKPLEQISVAPEDERIRLKDDARLETPPKDPTPEQVSARERFAARLGLARRRTHSDVAKSQRRDARGRFSSAA
jgi:hypothetical protein